MVLIWDPCFAPKLLCMHKCKKQSTLYPIPTQSNPHPVHNLLCDSWRSWTLFICFENQNPIIFMFCFKSIVHALKSSFNALCMICLCWSLLYAITWNQKGVNNFHHSTILVIHRWWTTNDNYKTFINDI